ncbi:hypothetical protein [Streptomyces tricolor]
MGRDRNHRPEASGQRGGAPCPTGAVDGFGVYGRTLGAAEGGPPAQV